MDKSTTIQGLTRLFEMLDTNNDKIISGPELLSGFKSFGFTEQQAKDFLNHADLNHDGNISWEEYAKAMKLPSKPSNEAVDQAALWTLFKHLDRNNDGQISKKEWFDGMKELGQEEEDIKSFMKALDLNDDGFISQEEYKIGCGFIEDPITDWKALFDAMDKDKSGDISVDELATVFDRAGLPLLNSGIMQWIKLHDRNNDGKLNYDEFLSFVKTEYERST